jgi:phosphatidate phosphatase APP1
VSFLSHFGIDNPLAKHVTVYPTYGFQDPDDAGTWRFRVRVWGHRRLPKLDEHLFRALVPGDHKDDELVTLRDRSREFITDDDEGLEVSFAFDHDPEGQTFSFGKETDDNGLVEQDYALPADRLKQIFDNQPGSSKWLQLTAHVEGLTGKGKGSGRIRFLEPEGLSVVSDIDDTIKVSNVPAGHDVVARHTFLLPFEHVEDMLARYQKYGEDVSFHYVSGSPWQLYGLLQKFLIDDTGFPQGTFHMKDLRKSDLSDFVNDVRNFVAGKKYTRQQKIRQISDLMRNLPRRRFILIGDSGECDPEVFTHIRGEFEDQVEEIFIRKVTNEPEGSKRFDGIEIIPAAGLDELWPPPDCAGVEPEEG